jgi:cytochrome c biogenesis protein CcmG, thiol:disulfide interchange protein DsbE
MIGVDVGRNGRRWLVVLGLLVLACAASRPRQRTSGSVGSPLSLAAPDLDGRVVDVAAAQGKVRVVDFWATWCEPCKEAMPVLDRLEQELGSRGLQVYGVSIDDDPALIAAFLAKRPVRFRILWDQGAERLSRLDVAFMPVTLLIDRRGIIRHVHQGWDDGREKQQREEIEGLLAER